MSARLHIVKRIKTRRISRGRRIKAFSVSLNAYKNRMIDNIYLRSPLFMIIEKSEGII